MAAMLRHLYRSVCSAVAGLHVPVKALWSFGFVSDTSILLDDDLMQKRWQNAEGSTLAACHAAPVLLLGDSGSGKTGLSRALRNLPPPSLQHRHPQEPKTVEETRAEVSYVDMSWADWGRRLISDVGISEHVSAMLYFVAAEMKRRKVLGKLDEETRVKFFVYNAFICVLMQLFFVLLPACGLPLHFLFLLISFCLLYAPVNRSHNIHYILAYGTSIIVVLFHFAMTQDFRGSVDDATTALCATLFISFLCSLLMGAGCGSGIALALSLCLPEPPVSPTWQSHIVFASGLFGLLARKQKGRRVCPSMQAACFAVITAAAAATLYAKVMLLFYGFLGFLLGYGMNIGLECGHKVAPVLSLGSRHITLAMLLGLVLGLPLAHCINWRLIEFSDTPLSLALSLSATLFILYMQRAYYRTTYETSRRTPLLQKLMDDSADPRKPARFTLIECSGEARLRELLHVYMSPFAIYIITFRATDIDKDNSSCDATFASLSDWINRVAAHVEPNQRRVYLVATQNSAACADSQERRRRTRNLEQRLSKKYAHLLVEKVSNRCKEESQMKRNPPVIFQIKTHVREEGDEELKKLRRAIMQNATTDEPVPISWFHFLDVIQDAQSQNQEISRIPSFDELFAQVNLKCELNDSKQEFRKMLHFFSDCGEIFFDSSKECFSQFVLLDRSILEKIVCSLASAGSKIDMDHLRADIGRRNCGVPPDRIVDFLVSLNLLIPIRKAEGQSFLVPFNLPRSEAVPSPESPEQLCAAVFDFSDAHFHPSPLFLQLLALCQCLHNCSPDAPPSHIARNTAAFTHGRIRYDVSLLEGSPHKIWVHMFSNEPDPDAKTHASTLLHQLNCLVQHLCAAHFRSLSFTLQLVCECSLGCRRRLEELHTHEYRMATATFPYTMPMRHHIACAALPEGMRFPWPAAPMPAKLDLFSAQCVDFRFATDICILSHEAPPASLLETLKAVSERRAGRPVVLSFRSLGAGHSTCCDQFLLQKAHLAEAAMVVILLQEGSSSCRACREKCQETWSRGRGKVIPIVMNFHIEVPAYFDVFLCLRYHDNGFEERLRRTISAYWKEPSTEHHFIDEIPA